MSSPNISDSSNVAQVVNLDNENGAATNTLPKDVVDAQGTPLSSDTLHPSLTGNSVNSVPSLTAFPHPDFTTSMNTQPTAVNNDAATGNTSTYLCWEENTPEDTYPLVLKELNGFLKRLQQGNVTNNMTKYTDKLGHLVFLEIFTQELNTYGQFLPSFFKVWAPKILNPNRADIWIKGFILFPNIVKLEGIAIKPIQFKQLIFACEKILLHLLKATDFQSKFIAKRIEFDPNVQHPSTNAFLQSLTGHETFPDFGIQNSLTLTMSFVRSLPVVSDSDYASPHFESAWKIIKENFNPPDAFDKNVRTLADLNQTLNDQLRTVRNLVSPHITLETMLVASTLLEEYSHIAPNHGETEFANIVISELDRVIKAGKTATFNTSCLSSWYSKYSQGSWLTNKDKLIVTSFTPGVPRKRALENSTDSAIKRNKVTPPISPPEHQFLPRGTFKFTQPDLAEFSHPWCSTCGYGHELGKHIFIGGKLSPEFPENEKEKLIKVDKALANLHPHFKRKNQTKNKRGAFRGRGGRRGYSRGSSKSSNRGRGSGTPYCILTVAVNSLKKE